MTHTGGAAAPLKRGHYTSIPGKYYGTPTEVFGFHAAARRGPPERIAREFLLANCKLFKLEPDLAGLKMQRVVHSLGASHVILQQIHGQRRVHRGYVTVHIDRAGRVFLAKNRSMPARLLPARFELNVARDEAVQHARNALPQPNRPSEPRETELLWFPCESRLVPAWKVRLTREAPREEWIIYLDTRDGALLNQYDNLAAARARVFDPDLPDPLAVLDGHALLSPNKRRPHPAYRRVILKGPDGSAMRSGEAAAPADLQPPAQPHQHGCEAAIHHHIDSALQYLEQLGFKGARAIFREPVQASVSGAPWDHSGYSPVDRTLTFSTGDAGDAATILHELGHAIQDAICPDFGQTAQAAAMGEGFGDYFAASFREAHKPPRERNMVTSRDKLPGNGDGPLRLRGIDNALTADDFDEAGGEHDNGLIWSATLWTIRAALGRRTADRLIVESHFQLDGFTDFARGARAILDADRNLEQGKNQAALKKIFKRRKIDPL